MQLRRTHLRRRVLHSRAAIGLLFVAAIAGATVSGAAEPGPVPAPSAEPPVLDPVPAADVPRPAAPIPRQPARFGPLDSQSPTPSRKFISDRIAVQKIELAKEKLASEDYGQAVRLLQAVLDRPQDGMIPDERHAGRYESLKGMADRLLEKLPPAGRRAYETQFGIGAQAELETALKAGDWRAIENIARRFFRTKAGKEATYRLAMRQIDRGKPLFGALWLDRLKRSGAERFEPQLTMRLLRAARQAGLSQLAKQARRRWESLAGRGGGGLPEQGRSRFAEWLKQAVPSPTNERDNIWSTLAGARDGVAAPENLTVAGGVVWSYPFAAPETDDDEPRSLEQKLARAFNQVAENARAMGDITIPAFTPVIVGDVAIFRTFLDLRAVDTSTGRLLWRTAHARAPLLTQVIPQLSQLYVEGFQHDQSDILRAQVYLSQYAFRNMTSGSLTTDGQRVYALRGTGLARSGISISVMRGNRRAELGQNPFNTLVAYDIAAQGRIAWTVGGPPEAAQSTGLFFLGPPLPVGGMLFALAERDGEILLLAIDPDASAENRIAWEQPLAMADHALNADPLRRLAGLTPSFEGGLLICPTGTGAVVAVDLRDRTLRWGYRYQRIAAGRSGLRNFRGRGLIMGFGGGLEKIDRRQRWIDAVPRIAGSSVLVTPRDSDHLHCLDLATGQMRWTLPRESFLYVASVAKGQVVLVGEKQIAAFDLATETPLWRTEFGVELRPSGRGLVTGGSEQTGRVYYLPSVNGRIYAVDLASGRIIASSKLGGEFVPGNLAAVNGRIISFSARAILGFRHVSKLDDLDDSIPGAAALARRGENRLMRGQIAAGIADLRAAIQSGENERARELLIDILLSGMRRDFPTYREHAADVKSLLQSPRRRIEFARVYADGLAAADQPVAAARTLVDLCHRGVDLGEYQHLGDQWQARLDRVIRAELGEIYDDATPENQHLINAIVRGQLKKFQQAASNDSLAKLATLAYGTGARNDVLAALMIRYRDTGDRLRARLLAIELGQDTGNPGGANNGIPAPAAEATLLPHGERNTAGWRARYRPDQLDAPEPPTAVPNIDAIRLVGAVPERFAGWSFATDASRQHVIAFDAWGRQRWRIAIRHGRAERGLPGAVDRFQGRFYGPLLAIGLGRLVVMLDTTNPAEQPRLLWSKAMPVTNATTFRRNQFGMFQEAGSRPPRFGFAGPRVIIYSGNELITAVESVTGKKLWSIPRNRVESDVLGDSQYVVLAATASDAKIHRTADGALLNRDQEGVLAVSLAGTGTKIIRWEKREEEQGYTLRCYDLARRESVWHFSYPLGTMLCRVGTDRVAVLEPAAGQLQVIRWTDGQIEFTAAIEPNPRINAFSLWRAGDRWILLTRTNLRRVSGQPRLGPPWEPFRGLVRGLDAAGHIVWSRELEQCAIHHSVPRQIPLVLALSSRRNLDNGRLHWRLEVIDAATGQTLITKERENFFVPMAVVGQPQKNRIEIRVPAARFVFEVKPEAPAPREPAS